MVHYLDKKKQFQMVDCTFGGGNHSVPLLLEYPNLRVLGVDMDYKVLKECEDAYNDLIERKRLGLVHSNYVHIPSIDIKKLFKRKITMKEKFDIALLDLGFSSY